MNKLPIQLQNSFNKLYNLRQNNNNTVLIYNRETQKHEVKTIFRDYMGYLNTPKYNPETKKAYMHVHKQENTPVELLPFVEFAKSIDSRYNEMVVNWYDKDDYIEMHSDCTSSFIDKDAPILVLNFNETSLENRDIVFENRETKEITKLPLLQDSYFIINNNTTHRHGVNKGLERRVSITFRMIKEGVCK